MDTCSRRRTVSPRKTRRMTSVFLLLLLSAIAWISHSFSLSPATLKSTNRQRILFASSQAQNDELSRGDARGAALLVEGVAISRGSSQILKQIDWRIEPKAKWALLGTNGCGKSTILKAIMEEIPYDGKITVGTTQQVGYLRQTAVAGSTKTIFDEAASAMADIEAARISLEKAQNKVAESEHPTDKELNALDRATERYEQVGGYQQEQEVTSMLKGLGFTDLYQTCDQLSGGWQMRVSFAKLLLSKPTLCLLDEPGNHLDRPARKWLANYLKKYEGGAMILVTHDRELLEAMDHIAEINAGCLQAYKSVSYTDYLEQKEQRRKAAQAEYDRNVEKAEKLQGFVDRFGASATKASAAQSRVKQLEKMKASGALDAPPEAVMQENYKPILRLPDPPKSLGDDLLVLKGASIGYDKSAPLVTDIDLSITRGMKLLIRGPNGAGKSTLLHSLRGELTLLDGERKQPEYTNINTFSQDLAQELDISARGVDLVTAYARAGSDGDITISDQQARTVMGGLGLRGEKALRKVGDLSGGEKARVALAMFALKPSNVYLLDEVSNHLDVECVEALSEALSDWDEDERAAIVVISHDKAFCEQIGFTHVATVKDGQVTIEQRNTRDSDWDSSAFSTQPSLNGGAATKNHSLEEESLDVAEEPPKKDVDPKLRKQAYNAPKRITKIEREVEKAEERIAELDAEMLSNGSDVGLLTDLSREKEQLESMIESLMEEWSELEELLLMVA